MTGPFFITLRALEEGTNDIPLSRYFRAYTKFFTNLVKTHGADAVLDKYVFSIGANWVDGIPDDKQPQLLNLFLSAALHPYIHVGYGIEFDHPGMIVEGSLLKTSHKLVPDASTFRTVNGVCSQEDGFRHSPTKVLL